MLFLVWLCGLVWLSWVLILMLVMVMVLVNLVLWMCVFFICDIMKVVVL